MAQYLPMFPLNLVIFPGERRELYIFEPRYKQLIQACRDEGLSFGIPIVTGKQLAEIATEVSLVSIDDVFEGGEMQITIEGKRRFKLLKFDAKSPSKLYPGGSIEWLEDKPSTPAPDLKEKIFGLAQKLSRLLDNLHISSTSADEIQAFQLAQYLSIDLQQKYQILSADNENDRLEIILDHLEVEFDRLKVKFNGHFKDMILPDS